MSPPVTAWPRHPPASGPQSAFGGSPFCLIHALLDLMPCQAAVKAGNPLTPEEIDALIARKDLIEKPRNCPHGRPTTLQMNLRELERQFKRN